MNKKAKVGSELNKSELKKISGGNIDEGGAWCSVGCGPDQYNWVQCSSETGLCNRSTDNKKISCDGIWYDCPA